MHGPNAPLLDAPPLARYGLPEYVKGAQPAAGALFSDSAPGQNAIRLITVWARVVTDGTVANRTVYIEFRDPEGNTFAIAGAPVTQSASSTNDYAWQAFVGQSDWSINNVVLLTLPPILLLPTFSWRINIANVQAGDQLSAIRYTQERFYTGNPLALPAT